MPRYVANEAARRLQAELCSWGAEWRVAELPGAREPRAEARRKREIWRESCLVLGLVPGRCDKVRDDDGWRGTDETEQSLFPLPQSSSIED